MLMGRLQTNFILFFIIGKTDRQRSGMNKWKYLGICQSILPARNYQVSEKKSSAFVLCPTYK